MSNINQTIIKRTLKVPQVSNPPTENLSETITRQLDIALISAGFKLSKDLIKYLSSLHPTISKDYTDDILQSARELVGDHIQHNVYFKEFPNNVPDTKEFWMECIADALLNPESASIVAAQLQTGFVNLLDLPKYGKYQHSYEEMLAAHDEFIPSIKDRVTILHLGKLIQQEACELYTSLAESRVPLNEEDLQILKDLAQVCLYDPQPDNIPIRENKAVINAVRIQGENDILADTPTDILRLAVQLSGGDVSLQTATKFKSISRKHRKLMMGKLNEIIYNSPLKLSDVNLYKEQWKRLGEILHPHEFSAPYAQDAFKVARGEMKVQSTMGRVESAFSKGDSETAVKLLSNMPGVLVRNIDRILRTDYDDRKLSKIFESVAQNVSSKVLLSLVEHLSNRTTKKEARIFANKKGTAFVTEDTRAELEPEKIKRILHIIDVELMKRLPGGNIIVDKKVLDLAIPLSNKQTSSGFRIMPRGSEVSIDSQILRFFCYWKENKDTTDYDLSAILLNEKFEMVDQISYTNLKGSGAVHSGDITSSTNGATEFIDIELDRVQAKYIVPQINIFSGEKFTEVQECFFGFMNRTTEQKGKPFEPSTVQTKSDLRDSGNVALPMIFIKDENNKWTAKWLHLYLKGHPRFNATENNKLTTSLLTKSFVEKEYLKINYLTELLMAKNKDTFSWYIPEAEFGIDKQKTEEVPGNVDQPFTYIGIDVPENLPPNTKTITLTNLHEIIPENL